MSFDRPSPDDNRRTVSDTELNEALENDKLEKGTLDFDSVEHEEGLRSRGPEPNEGRRTPPSGDVKGDAEDPAVEPPD